MLTIPNRLTRNFHKAETRRQLMRKYGDLNTAFSGVNALGESVLVSISYTGIQVKTNQKNGWVRVDTYDELGYKDSESFDGKWKS